MLMITHDELSNGLAKLQLLVDEALRERILSRGGSVSLNIKNGNGINLCYDDVHNCLVATNVEYGTSEIVHHIEDKLLFIKLLDS